MNLKILKNWDKFSIKNRESIKEQLKCLCGTIGYFFIIIYFYVITIGSLLLTIHISFEVMDRLNNFRFMMEIILVPILIFTLLAATFSLCAVWAVFKVKKRDLFEEVFLKPISRDQIILSIGIGTSLRCMMFGSSIITGKTNKITEAASQLMLKFGSSTIVIYSIFIILAGFVTLIAHEILFRGVIYQTLRKKFNVFISIAVQAFLWGLIFIRTPNALLQNILLGGVLGYLTYRTQSVMSSIIIQVTNLLLMMSILFLPQGLIGYAEGIKISVLGLGTGLVFITLLTRNASKAPKQKEACKQS